MVNRFVSLTALLCLGGISLFGKLIPDSPLFFFVSSNKLVALVRLLLVSAMIWVSFRGYVAGLKMRRYIWLTGLWLIGIGSVVMLATQINGVLFDYFKPLDLLLLIESGVIFSLVSLEIPQTGHTPKKLKSAPYSKSRQTA